MLVSGQACNGTSCIPGYFMQPTTLKSNATNVYYVGNMYNNQIDSNSLVKMAIVDINNNPSILPNVRLELYHYLSNHLFVVVFGFLELWG